MYVPAVLRPTEKPARQSPPKRGGQPTVTDQEDTEEVEGDTSSVRRVVTEEWNETRLGEVMGPPSRNHWKVSYTFSLSCHYHHIWLHSTLWELFSTSVGSIMCWASLFQN
jgi:hypothetical protein